MPRWSLAAALLAPRFAAGAADLEALADFTTADFPALATPLPASASCNNPHCIWILPQVAVHLHHAALFQMQRWYTLQTVLQQNKRSSQNEQQMLAMRPTSPKLACAVNVILITATWLTELLWPLHLWRCLLPALVCLCGVQIQSDKR